MLWQALRRVAELRRLCRSKDWKWLKTPAPWEQALFLLNCVDLGTDSLPASMPAFHDHRLSAAQRASSSAACLQSQARCEEHAQLLKKPYRCSLVMLAGRSPGHERQRAHHRSANVFRRCRSQRSKLACKSQLEILAEYNAHGLHYQVKGRHVMEQPLKPKDCSLAQLHHSLLHSDT